ncbi:DUF1273 domain-containing protein [Furfurilactobacillus sp. WILCCON 0119]|uniref:DUF1273 domain-containing protein n=1 Tax=Furfurilactobacillus entadae TaxID=2922307 RepID=UPI0035E8DF29
MSRLWVSGYRSYELGVFGTKDPKLAVIQFALKQALINQIENGVDWIITGGQLGVEQWVVTVANELKTDYPQLKVAVMLPFAEFGGNWNEANQAQLSALLETADFTASVSDQPYQSPQQLKNYQAFMLSHTDAALLVYDEEHEGKPSYDYLAIKAFSEDHPYTVTLIDFDWLQESANEYQENQQQSF